MDDKDYMLLLKCPDRPGIVHDVSGAIFKAGGNIIDSAQFGDQQTGFFCMRIHFTSMALDEAYLQQSLTEAGNAFDMEWTLCDGKKSARVLVMVSAYDHCLRDILYRREIGELNIEIPAVVSNHRTTYQLVTSQDIPFYHLPVSKDVRSEQEAALLDIVDRVQRLLDFEERCTRNWLAA